VALVAGVIGLAGAGLLAQAQGGRLVVIAGSSMSPDLPIGSLAFERPAPPEAVLVGEVVTVRGAGGLLVTHRVTRQATLDGVDYVETRGDANPMPDPVLVPRSAVIGRVQGSVPYLGYLEVTLSRPAGWLAILGLLVLLWTAAELLHGDVPRARALGAPATSRG
jgi:signal peptidase